MKKSRRKSAAVRQHQKDNLYRVLASLGALSILVGSFFL